MTMRGIQTEVTAQPETVDDIVFPKSNTTGEGELPSHSGTAMLAVRRALELKELRIERGLTIEDIASKAGLDVAILSKLENGRVFNPKLDTLSRYALALGSEIETRYVATDPGHQD